ncbi:MAG: hypothetical protein ACYTBJ_06205 [Planctomycetota bacterium]|jgi:hypothetical protein
MITDEQVVKEGLDFFRANLDFIADRADGGFIDLTVRPKSDRRQFTVAQYKKDMLARCEWWETTEEVSIGYKFQQLHALKDFVIQILDNQFQRWRDVYNILMQEPPELSVTEREVLKARTQKIRADQNVMEWYDRKLKCPMCGLPIYIRDINNNYIDLKKKGKREVCTEHKASERLRSRIKKEREDRRRDQEGKKKKARPEKDPERYK